MSPGGVAHPGVAMEGALGCEGPTGVSLGLHGPSRPEERRRPGSHRVWQWPQVDASRARGLISVRLSR